MSKVSKKSLKADFCVIGAGSGGLSFAAAAVQMGASVILLESKKMGGDCLNNGCVPSKSLIAAANAGHEIRSANRFGWSVEKAEVNFEQVHDHVHSVIHAIEPHDSIERFEGLGVKVIIEAGKFVDKSTVETDTYYIKAKRFIIATGSIPFVPPIEGLSSISYYTNETIFDLKECPKHLVVIGGGPIGIEIAQAFKRLGSQVSVLEAFTALPKDDSELSARLKSSLISEGITFKENVKILSLKQEPSGIEIDILTSAAQLESVIASHVLVATGRRANIQQLNLEAAKIVVTKNGMVLDKYLRTSNRRIYAIGDCAGGYQFTHVASYHAGLVIRNTIFKLRASVQTQAIPWVTYTDPELAHVGLIESQLHTQKIRHKVLKMTFEENDRAQAEKRTEGVIKVLVSPKGEILGATILGAHAGELILPWVMAIQNKLKISHIANTIAPYPTLSEINKRVAGSFYIDKLFGSGMKRIVKWLMRMTR